MLKAHILVYHSTLGLRVIQKKKKHRGDEEEAGEAACCCAPHRGTSQPSEGGQIVFPLILSVADLSCRLLTHPAGC